MPGPLERARPGRERLQRVLAAAGLASRREAERWIVQGRVTVNGRVVRALGSRADPARDAITVDGRPIPSREAPSTYVLYKPPGVVTTTRDPHARRAAVDLVPSGGRLFPVGRLDAASEGLLLLTNDGPLAYVLTHPSFEVPRTYRVTVEGRMEEETLGRLRAGVEIGGRPSIPRTVEVLERGRASSLLEITLCEGRKRQIRETMRAVGHPVRRLLRTRFGPVRLGRLASGCWRRLRPSEERALRRLVSRVQVGARAPALRELSRRERSSARGR